MKDASERSMAASCIRGKAMSDLQQELLASISADEMWKHLERLCQWDRDKPLGG